MAREYVSKGAIMYATEDNPYSGEQIFCDVCDELLSEDDVKTRDGQDFCPPCYDAQDWGDW